MFTFRATFFATDAVEVAFTSLSFPFGEEKTQQRRKKMLNMIFAKISSSEI